MNRLVRWGGTLVAALAASLSVASTTLQAQQGGVGTIEGTVTDAGTGRPIEGAQVGSTTAGIGAVTNGLGKYRLTNVPARSIELRVRMVGYTPATKTVTVTAGGTATADFAISQSALQLQAVVTTGTAGATEVKKLGNSVATIDPPKYAPIATPSELLQGREPGVVGLSTSGLAGEGMKIRIRGNASLTQSNEPIVFVDGMRINSAGSQTGGSSISRIDDIDPATIERVEILKGAAAATLYGTEASNGVIQIFTKRGTAGTPKWDFQVNQDMSSYPTNRLDDNYGYATSAAQLARLTKLWGRSDLALYKPFSEPLQRDYFETGMATTASASLTGGTQNLNYFLAGRYNKDDGPFASQKLEGLANDFIRRSSGNLNVSSFPTSKLRIGGRAQYVNQYADRPEYGNNIYSPITLLGFSKPELGNCDYSNPTGTDPDFGIAGPQKCKFGGNRTGSPGAFGTPFETGRRTAIIAADRYLSALDAQYTPIPELSFSGTLGVDYTSETTTNFAPFGYNVDGIIGDHVLGYKGIYQWNDREVTVDLKANWQRDFTKTLNSQFIAGVQGFISRQKFPGSNGYDFPGPGVAITSATGVQYANDGVTETVNGGYFVQEQLGYKNYLYLTAGARYDYSSAFGKSAAGVVYPKVSVSFVPTDFAGHGFGPISSWRLRAAWGQSGRQPSAFAKFTTFSAAGGPAGAGLGPDNLGNPELKPEVATEIEGGTELGFLNDRFGIELTYWDRKVKDLLYNVQYPPSGGFVNAQLTNVGQLDAKGFELGAKGFLVQTPGLSIDVFGNVAYLSQKIASLGGAPNIKVNPNYARIRAFIREGYAPGQWFGAKVKSVAAGSLPYDAGIITGGKANGVAATEAQMLAYLASPRTYLNLFNGSVILLENGLESNLGKPTPDYTGSFGGSMTFRRNWRVNTLFEYKGGNYTYWCLICGFRNASPRGNNSEAAARVQSTLENPASTAQQRLAAAKEWVYDLASLTPYQGLNEVSDGSFVRFRELSLTYTAPQSLAAKIRARELAVSLTGRNLMLWTKYQGVDPEVTSTGRTRNGSIDDNFQDSIDAFGLPVPRRFGISVRLGY
ncbi:MAG: SusC/RagA family TonB-linked outer membrane protein [Gemmatimonadaceae bacterium]|nr:SusC/RagA family TonB-linked outer membrane protein [Gemmatimonadaceae bacterium]